MASYPPPPAAHVDWDNLKFEVRKVNGHVECRYNAQTGEWSEPELVEDPFLKIHGLCPALNYGQQAYEGLKAYRDNSNKINVFRTDKHAWRLTHSVAYVSIPEIPVEHFIKAVHLSVSANAEYVPPHYTGACLYLRPLVFGSGAFLGLTPQSEYIFVIYCQPAANYHGIGAIDALVMEEFDRAAPKGTGSAKVGGNYAPVMRWSDKARAEGYGVTLHLDSKTNTEIDEFSTSGFLGVKAEGSGYTLVVPDSKNCILSITSDSCQDLAKSMGWKVEKRPIKWEEVASFDEVFAAGTAASLVPIKSITRKSTEDKFVYLADGKPGPRFFELSKALKDVQQGLAPDNFGWLDQVHEVKDIKLRSAEREVVRGNHGSLVFGSEGTTMSVQ